MIVFSESSFREYQPKASHSPPPSPPPSGVLRPGLVSTTIAHPEVRRLLPYYHHQVSRHLGGFMNIDFWSVTIPQLAQQEPAVAYAIAAISATLQRIHSTAASHHDVLRDSVCADGPSLQYYNMALVKTNERVAQDGGRLIATLTCLLFLCMEFLQSNKRQSKRLFDRLCQLLHPCKDQAWSRSTDLHLVPNIRSMYRRIVLQSLLFVHPIPPHYYQDWTLQPFHLPKAFHSLSEARDTLYKLLVVMHDFCKLARTTPEPFDHTRRTSVTGPEEQAYLVSKLGQWRKLFSDWNAKNHPSCPESSQSVSLLRLYDHISMAWLINPWETSQLPFDAAKGYFQLAVEEASSILATPVPEAKLCSSFHFEMGVLPPLYFTAIKCRHQELRLRALSLLRQAPRREGLWDREELVAVAERVMEIENTGVSSPGVLVPDEHRVCHVTMKQEDKGDTLSAIFSFKSHGLTENTSQVPQSWTWNTTRGKFILCP